MYVCVCVFVEKNIYFKELAYVIVEAGKYKICRVSWQAGDQGDIQYFCSSPKAICWQNSLLLGGGQTSVLVRPSTDCRRPIHIGKGSLLYSKPINLNINFIPKKTLTGTSRVMFDLISRHHGLATLTHEINHHDVCAGGSQLMFAVVYH